ncbi:hypothetical protein EDB89DRAFT_1462668 [Lactarius sanguifluus]|nr:hypothetical protein EDB89DRAFT_1462668 [Lactarius sanguifluus]
MTSVSSEVPTHGNYHDYHVIDPCLQLITLHFQVRYHHLGGHDSRLTLLPHDLLVNARVLNVGCNEGLGLLRDRRVLHLFVCRVCWF